MDIERKELIFEVMLKELSSVKKDVHTMKSILIFFLIMYLINLALTIMMVISLANAF